MRNLTPPQKKASRLPISRFVEVVPGRNDVEFTPSLLPGRADFGALPPPVLVRSVRELRERLAGAPPECLRPRRLADGVVAFAIAEVVDLGYAAAEQTCHARLLDASGEALEVRLEHRTVAPHALESFAAALSQGARFVTGHARWDGSAVWLDALAVATDEALVVPDLAERTPQRAIAPRPLADPQGPLAPVLSAAGHVLAEVAGLWWLLLAGALLVATGGLSYVAPFFYAIF